jgi:hypothetical protein
MLNLAAEAADRARMRGARNMHTYILPEAFTINSWNTAPSVLARKLILTVSLYSPYSQDYISRLFVHSRSPPTFNIILLFCAGFACGR